MKLTTTTFFFLLFVSISYAQNPSAFTCSGNDGFGYYVSSASSSTSGNLLTNSSSRLSKLTTADGSRTTLCTAVQIGVALNGLAFNPQDNFLYAVSRYVNADAQLNPGSTTKVATPALSVSDDEDEVDFGQWPAGQYSIILKDKKDGRLTVKKVFKAE